MSKHLDDIEPMIYESRISVPYQWWAGETASAFFVSLRDRKIIQGTRCPDCSRVYVPPRKTCPSCFNRSMKPVEVSNSGTVTAYTVARRQFASLPRKVPVIFGLVQLDGADTSLLHYIEGVDPDEMSIGLRVEAEYAEERTGNIRDIKCFRAIGQERS